MADEEKKKDVDEWMAEERARLKKGFTYTPKPGASSGSGAAEDVLAGLGLGAGVVGGAVAPHPNPITFEGVSASVIASALKAEIARDDTRVHVDRTSDSVMVTFLLSQEGGYNFLPVLTATLLETPDQLTVTLSKLDQSAVRDALTSMGSTVVDQGKDLLFGGRGLAGLLDTAGSLIEGVGDLAEDIEDLSLPKRVWEVIDRVGGAAEETYLEEKRKEQEALREREETERAWTHCPSCGRAYGPDEVSKMNCPSCGASRGDKPAWM